MRAAEQTRARYPDADGFVERDGVRVHWERYGSSAPPAYLLLPTWEAVHSRTWKCQIPYLARYGTVITFDPRGNGRSDRPRNPALYARREYAEDAVAVLDAAGVDRALVVAWCDLGESLILAAEHPERVAGLVEIAPAIQLGDMPPEPVAYPFDAPLDTDEGWAKENRHYWLRDWRGYTEFFFGECFSEPHSTKQIEDAVDWSLETDPETMLLSFRGWNDKVIERAEATAHAGRIACPGVVIHGTEDRLVEAGRGRAVAEALGWGHVSIGRLGPRAARPRPRAHEPAASERRARGRPPSCRRPTLDARGAAAEAGPLHLLADRARPRVARRRDRRRAAEAPPRPRDRLAGPGSRDPRPRGPRRAHPSRLGRPGERVGPHRLGVGRPRPARLPGDPADGRDPGRELHGLPRPRGGGALRRVDRRRGLGDRLLPAREPGAEDGRVLLAHRLRRLAADAGRGRARGVPHGRPERRDDRAHRPLPAHPRPGDLRREPRGHRARHVRARAPGDQGVDRGPLRLLGVRDRAARPTGATGRSSGPSWATGRSEQVCIATVGGSGVGGALLRHVVDELRRGPPARPRPANDRRRRAADRSRRRSPGATASRCGRTSTSSAATWPRATSPSCRAGSRRRWSSPAAKRPFLYFPLGHHFEQRFHVRHRLDRYGAGRCMDFDDVHSRVARGRDRRRDRKGGGLSRRRDRRRRPCSGA